MRAAFLALALGGCASAGQAIRDSAICSALCDASPEARGRLTVAVRAGDACLCQLDADGKFRRWTVRLGQLIFALHLASGEGGASPRR